MGATLDTDALVARVSRKVVLGASVGSLVLFAAVAWLAAAAQRRTLASLFWADGSLASALVFGLLVGVVAALAVTAAVLYTSALRDFRALLRAAYAKARLRRADMLLVAVNAGTGEELLFRGIVQPLLGLGWTSLVFALLHLPGVPRSRGRAAFGLYVFVVSLALGALYERRGLAAAMAAHAAFDFVFLVWSARALAARDPVPNLAAAPGVRRDPAE